ncbi:response regulator [Sphingomonas sp. LY160]|nr:response regulator [Sphingomonas sp. LY160]MEA1070909.1 response regulator [Sphingomonas sp. LY160]
MMVLTGKRVLVIEDSPLIATAAADILVDLGCIVLGPVGNMADARQLCENEMVDAALVDLNIRGTKAFALLKILSDRQIPFVLTSGYADWSMPEEWRQSVRVQKPYSFDMVQLSLTKALMENS